MSSKDDLTYITLNQVNSKYKITSKELNNSKARYKRVKVNTIFGRYGNIQTKKYLISDIHKLCDELPVDDVRKKKCMKHKAIHEEKVKKKDRLDKLKDSMILNVKELLSKYDVQKYDDYDKIVNKIVNKYYMKIEPYEFKDTILKIVEEINEYFVAKQVTLDRIKELEDRINEIIKETNKEPLIKFARSLTTYKNYIDKKTTVTLDNAVKKIEKKIDEKIGEDYRTTELNKALTNSGIYDQYKNHHNCLQYIKNGTGNIDAIILNLKKDREFQKILAKIKNWNFKNEIDTKYYDKFIIGQISSYELRRIIDEERKPRRRRNQIVNFINCGGFGRKRWLLLNSYEQNDIIKEYIKHGYYNFNKIKGIIMKMAQ